MRVGVIGGAGYTAGELLRLLVNHPAAEIAFVHSDSNAGNALGDVHGGLLGETDLRFTAEYDLGAIDVLFLCSAHGRSREFLAANALPEGLRIVDLAQDFRDESEGFVYGLPELNRDRIRAARRVANPGCFATAIQLALLPLAREGLLREEVHATAVTGSTGAGVKPSATTHFSWRTDNISVYKAFTHQHLSEIGRTLGAMQGARRPKSTSCRCAATSPAAFWPASTPIATFGRRRPRHCTATFYADAAFTFVADRPIDLKQAVNTNKAVVQVAKYGRKLHIVSVIDNLLKGGFGAGRAEHEPALRARRARRAAAQSERILTPGARAEN